MRQPTVGAVANRPGPYPGPAENGWARSRLRRLCGSLALAAAALCGTPLLAADIQCTEPASGRRVLTYHGGVDAGDDDTFAKVFNRCFGQGYRGPVTVDLFSGGGLVNVGLAISRMIVDHGRRGTPVTVRVSRGNYCISACTYLFVAGRFRELEPGASLEPHGFSGYLGERLDQAIAGELERKAFNMRDNEIAAPRLVFMASALAPLTSTDSRFAWAHKFLDVLRGGRYSGNYVEQLCNQFAALQPEQRRLLAHLDSITQLVMTEVERHAALTAFKPHLDGLAGRPRSTDVALVSGREQADWSRLSGAYLKEINAYLAAVRGEPPLRDLAMAKADAQAALAEQVRSTMLSVNTRLWPYLETRAGDIDLEGFVRLMFSTSILYMRPLTREELCDFNLVNRDCT